MEGGSYVVDASLTVWNLWVLGLGQYPPDLWKKMLEQHKIGRLSNFDGVIRASIKSMRRLKLLGLFDSWYMFEVDTAGFKGSVRSLKPVIEYSEIITGFETPGRETRPNGYDGPTGTRS